MNEQLAGALIDLDLDKIKELIGNDNDVLNNADSKGQYFDHLMMNSPKKDKDTCEFAKKVQNHFINKCSKEGLYPVHLAFLNNKYETVKFMITSNPGLAMCRTSNGFLPIHFAYHHRQFDLAKLIFQTSQNEMKSIDYFVCIDIINNINTKGDEKLRKQNSEHIKTLKCKIFNKDRLRGVNKAYAEINKEVQDEIDIYLRELQKEKEIEDDQRIDQQILTGSISTKTIIEGFNSSIKSQDPINSESLSVQIDEPENGNTWEFFTQSKNAQKYSTKALEKVCELIGPNALKDPKALTLSVINDLENFVTFLIQNNVDINQKDSKNHSAVYYAIKNNNERIVRMLIQETMTDRKEALSAAIMLKNEDMMEYIGNTMLTYKEDLTRFLDSFDNLKDVLGLFLVTYIRKFTGNKVFLKALLDKKPSMIEVEGSTALGYCAALLDDGEVVEMLVNAGADIEARDSNNKTPVERAKDGSKYNSAAALIICGASSKIPNLPRLNKAFKDRLNQSIRTPDFMKVVTKLKSIKSPVYNEVVHCVIDADNLEVSKKIELINEMLKEDISVISNMGLKGTPLHYACSKNEIEIAKFLLLKEAENHNFEKSIWETDRQNKKPMMLFKDPRSKNRFKEEVFNECFKIDINMEKKLKERKNFDFESFKQIDLKHEIIRIWIKNDNVDAIKKIIKNSGLTFIMGCTNYYSPLHCALYCKSTKTAKYFIENYPYMISNKDIFEDTPLHIAAKEGLDDTVKLLIKKASIEFNSEELSPYEVTSNSNIREQILKLYTSNLLEHPSSTKENQEMLIDALGYLKDKIFENKNFEEIINKIDDIDSLIVGNDTITSLAIKKILKPKYKQKLITLLKKKPYLVPDQKKAIEKLMSKDFDIDENKAKNDIKDINDVIKLGKYDWNMFRALFEPFLKNLVQDKIPDLLLNMISEPGHHSFNFLVSKYTINAVDSKGQTVLHKLALSNYIDEAKFLSTDFLLQPNFLLKNRKPEPAMLQLDKDGNSPIDLSDNNIFNAKFSFNPKFFEADAPRIKAKSFNNFCSTLIRYGRFIELKIAMGRTSDKEAVTELIYSTISIISNLDNKKQSSDSEQECLSILLGRLKEMDKTEFNPACIVENAGDSSALFVLNMYGGTKATDSIKNETVKAQFNLLNKLIKKKSYDPKNLNKFLVKSLERHYEAEKCDDALKKLREGQYYQSLWGNK